MQREEEGGRIGAPLCGAYTSLFRTVSSSLGHYDCTAARRPLSTPCGGGALHRLCNEIPSQCVCPRGVAAVNTPLSMLSQLDGCILNRSRVEASQQQQHSHMFKQLHRAGCTHTLRLLHEMQRSAWFCMRGIYKPLQQQLSCSSLCQCPWHACSRLPSAELPGSLLPVCLRAEAQLP